jgi:hypothetical protein
MRVAISSYCRIFGFLRFVSFCQSHLIDRRANAKLVARAESGQRPRFRGVVDHALVELDRALAVWSGNVSVSVSVDVLGARIADGNKCSRLS